MTILDICHKINHFIAQSDPELNSRYNVSPDGNDAFETEGTINIYPDNNQQAKEIQNIMNIFISRASNMLTIEGPRIEEHQKKDDSYDKMLEFGFEGDEDYTTPIDEEETIGTGKIRVMRYDVTENKTSLLEKSPSMHLSNSNAQQLINMLRRHGLYNEESEDLYGIIEIEELEKIIKNIELDPASVKKYTRETTESKGKVKITDFGLEEVRLWEYINMLHDMINYAKKEGYREIGYA